MPFTDPDQALRECQANAASNGLAVAGTTLTAFGTLSGAMLTGAGVLATSVVGAPEAAVFAVLSGVVLAAGG